MLSTFFSTHAWCISKKLPDISFIFSVLLHDVSHHKTICQKKSPKKLFLFSFQFLFLTYLFNNVSTRDTDSFTSAYICSFMPVLDWSIIPCRKTCFIFTNQLLDPKNLFCKQSVCICKQTNISQFITHACDLSYVPWKVIKIVENTTTP